MSLVAPPIALPRAERSTVPTALVTPGGMLSLGMRMVIEPSLLSAGAPGDCCCCCCFVCCGLARGTAATSDDATSGRARNRRSCILVDVLTREERRCSVDSNNKDDKRM